MRMRRLVAKFSTSPYRILGVPITATTPQIDEAVQIALKQAGFSFGARQQTSEQQSRVQQIFAAYAELSVEKNRGVAAAFVPKRPTAENYLPPSSAPEALRRNYLATKQLTMKRYNVNALGRYRGGPPRKHSYARGSALGEPGEYHSLVLQNELEGNNASSDFHVTRQDVVDLYRYRLDDEEAQLLKKTYFFAQPEEFSARRLKQFLRAAAGLALFFLGGRALEFYATRLPFSTVAEDAEGVHRLVTKPAAAHH